MDGPEQGTSNRLSSASGSVVVAFEAGERSGGAAARSGAFVVLQRIDEHEGRPARVRLGTVGQVNDAELPPVDFVRDIVSHLGVRWLEPTVRAEGVRKEAHARALFRAHQLHPR